MKRAWLPMLVLLFTATAFAQDPATGFPPFGSLEAGGFDAINRQNLNVNWAIPLVSAPARAGSFRSGIVYDSLIWKLSGGSPNAWTPVTDKSGNPTWGWKKEWPSGMSSFSKWTRQTKCFDEFGGWWWAPIITWSNYAYTDMAGTRHAFSVSWTSNACTGSESGTSTGYATDLSGFYIDITNPDSPLVTSPLGFNYPYGETATDTNGNYVSKTVVGNVTTWKDTAGHETLKMDKSNAAYIDYQYPDTAGTYRTIRLNLQTFSIKTNFACSGTVEYTGSASLPTSLEFRVGSPPYPTYQFTYEDTPNFPSYKTGRLKRVTLPTGGFYEYQYPPTGNNGINCTDGTVTSLTQVINDGTASATWQFVRTQIDASTWKTRVTPPGLSYDNNVPNESVFIFTNGRETSQKMYRGLEAGNQVVRTVNTTWAANGSPASKTVILEDGQTQSQTETVFDTYGNLTERREHAWGPAAPGAVVRTTQMSYLATTPYTTRNIRNRVNQILVRDGGPTGVIKSQTDILYDEPAYSNVDCPASIPQHDDANYGCSFLARGNPTTTTTYADAAAQTGPIVRHFSYDFFGNLRRADVSCCQQKQWNYSAATNFAYPDSVISGPPTGQQLTTSATYNFYTGLVMSTTDENNKVTSFTYDSLKRLIDIERPDHAHVTYAYNDAARTVTTNTPIDGTSVLTQIAYSDPLGRVYLQSSSAPEGVSLVETQFDVLGRANKRSNPYRAGDFKRWTETRFDALGRPIMVIPPDGSETANRTTYSYSGNTVTLTDPTDKKRKSETDALGRLIKVTEPDANGVLNVDTTYSYTVLDTLAAVTQGVQGRTYNYDDLGRLLNARTSETNQQPVSYQYNDFGLVTQRTDVRGVITTYDYDTLNRLRQVSYNVGSTGVPATATVVYTYGTNATQNNNGRLLTMTDGVGSETYGYDLFGRVTQVQKVITGTTYTIGYAYNLAGELTSFSYPSGRVVQQSYDTVGRLCAVGASGSSCSAGTRYARDFSYNPAGQVTAFSYGNGVTASLGYSPERLQLQSLTYAKPGQTLFSLSYGYVQNGGNNGQITSITDNVDPTRSMTYSYDPLARLKVAFAGPEANPTWKLDWDYDRYGNRPNQNVRAGSPPGPQLTIDPATNRITGTGYGYDANGNMTADGLNSLTYDAENRTVSVNGSTTYSYDGNSLRVKKVSGATTVYLFSGTKVIAEYVNGSLTKEYIYSGSALIAVQEGAALKYQISDHLSARVITDSSGNVLEQRAHYPFGETWYEGTGGTKWKFTTYERDAESLDDYAMARYYINRFGRFASPDPIAGSVADPQSLNRYTYARNDPIDLSDPLGLAYAICQFVEGSDGSTPGYSNCTVVSSADFYLFAASSRDLDFRGGDIYGTGGNLVGGYFWIPDPPDANSASGGNRRPEPGRDPGRERGDRERGNQSVVQRIKGLAKTAVCGVTQPLQMAAFQNQGAVGVGLGGSFGVGLIWGASVQGGIQVVADPSGRVGIAFTGGGNPGFGVLGVGGVGGVQFTNSDASSIFDLDGQSFGGGVSGGVAGVGAGVDVATSRTASTLTVTVGAGIGGRGTAVATTWTKVPQALSLSCN